MATPAEKGKSRAVFQIKQSLTDTVPPGKDTTKKVNVLYNPGNFDRYGSSKDTTKKVNVLYNQEVLTDTIPPKDTTKKADVLYIQ